MEKVRVAFGHPKETVRTFMRRILPDKCNIRLEDFNTSGKLAELLEDPEINAVVVDDSILTDAHVDIIKGASKNVVVITDNPARWAGAKTIARGYTIDDLINAIGGKVSEEEVTQPAPAIAEEKVEEKRAEVEVQAVTPAPVPAPAFTPVEEKVEIRATTPAPQPTVENKEVATATQGVIREEIRHIAREILWEILPDIAEKVLREEIRKLIESRLAK